MPVKKKAVKKAVKRVVAKKSLLKTLGDKQILLGAVPGQMSGLGAQAQIMYDPRTMSGGNWLSDLGKGFIKGFTLGAVDLDKKATGNINWLPFGPKGFTGLKPSQVASFAGDLTGNPLLKTAGTVAKAVGQGRKKRVFKK